MGISIYKRKETALKQVRQFIPEDINYYVAMDIARSAIDCYIGNGKIKNCECGQVISKSNTSGKCRRCYARQYRKKDQQKRLDMLRQRYYRKRKKEKALDIYKII